ncbi:hypothetical protein I4I73_26315 [Pseudonocardia sp. KRD-184]|uniref:Uncharacterized protein n=1 Tax=Pseudonocardia oceani TaxID=2792013 RepID=A0ABS6U625_9PSEU|nr:hypothetical protein [Pseudonocardia oceani]MBW0092685.1 hypothetical protein [Pseudonocardia oceani]MBW0099513.1 hypothetical protein [Pseudonocardia oceani]MBW0112101.1 hypothetical protein [Pseudonocardia oceani]MBW0125533.1 hypothetical protein [Pseudonocardia oceani]MBW0127680.1 hypothetical protein [Pseudonocardia oceani]
MASSTAAPIPAAAPQTTLIGPAPLLDVDGDRAVARDGPAVVRERLTGRLEELLVGLEVANAAHPLPSALRLRPADGSA